MNFCLIKVKAFYIGFVLVIVVWSMKLIIALNISYMYKQMKCSIIAGNSDFSNKIG